VLYEIQSSYSRWWLDITGSAVRLISGCLQPTQLSWLPVLSNVAPPSLYVVKRQLTICFKSLEPIQTGLCMLMCLRIHLYGLHLDAQYGQTWHLSTQLRSGQRTGRRLLLLPTLLCDSQVSISFVIYALWWTVSGQIKANVVLTSQMGSHPITFLWLWPATDNEPHCRHVPINKIWRWTESTQRSGWWRSHMAGIYSDWSTREIIPAAIITDRVHFNEWVFLPNKPNKQAFSLYTFKQLGLRGRNKRCSFCIFQHRTTWTLEKSQVVNKSYYTALLNWQAHFIHFYKPFSDVWLLRSWRIIISSSVWPMMSLSSCFRAVAWLMSAFERTLK